MAAAAHSTMIRRSRRVFALAALLALAVQLFPGEQETFMAPVVLSSGVAQTTSLNTAQGRQFVQGTASFFSEGAAESKTARGVVAESVGSHIIHAMGAGAVAAVIQAAFSAVGEPIVNRVLVKRMKVRDAIAEVKPAMMLKYFKTTLSTNLLKFPLFEGINAFLGTLAISASLRGFVTGFVFTTATLPVTNFRYRKSMQLPITWGNIYEAYLPTVIRDIVYAFVRSAATTAILTSHPGMQASSPSLLFMVVILGCFGSAPFNEWRGFLLQSKSKTSLTFKDFFKPKNFIRSTSLGALQQGLALAIGYWCAPPATRFVNNLIMSLKH